MPHYSNVIELPLPQAQPQKKPRNMTSDGRRCVRVDVGTDPVTGKRLRKAFYGKTLKEARAKADEYKRALAQGLDVSGSEQRLYQWIDTWISVYGQKGAPGTVRHRADCAKSLAASLGSMRLCDVRQIHVQRYADSLSHYTSAVVAHYRVVCQQIFRAAIANRILTFDPTGCVTWHGAPNTTHRMLTHAEIEAITGHWRDHPFGPLAMIMLYAGLRRGEALGLRWQDIDLSAGIIHVTIAMQVQATGRYALAAPKTKTSVRDVPILPVLRPVLESIPHDADRLFPAFIHDRQFALAVASYNEYLRTLLGPSFVLRSHDLRHTFASICYEAGVDIKTTQALLGHAQPNITMSIYTHLSNELKSSSIATLSDYVDSSFGHHDSQNGHQMGIK